MGFRFRSRLYRFGVVLLITVVFAIGVVGLGLVFVVLFSSTSFNQKAIAVLLWFEVAIVASLLLRPYSYRLVRGAQPARDERLATLRSICEHNDIEIRGFWLVTEPSKFTEATITGLLGGDRHLFINETLFEENSTHHLNAIIAREVKLVRLHNELYLSSALLFVWLIYFSINFGLERLLDGTVVSIINSLYLPEIGFLLGTVLVYRYGLQKVYGADQYAAAQTSPKTVINALKGVADSGGQSPKQTWPWSLLWMQPSTQQRIEQLQEEA